MKKAMIVIVLNMLSSACVTTGHGTHGTSKPAFVGLPLYKLDVVTHQKGGPMNRMVTYNTLAGVKGDWWSVEADIARTECWTQAALVFGRELCSIATTVTVDSSTAETSTKSDVEFNCRMSGIKAIEYYLDEHQTMHCLVEKSYEDYLLEK